MNFEQPTPQPRQWTYWQATRAPLYGLIIGVPLFLLYEGLLFLLDSSIVSGAEANLIALLPFKEHLNIWMVKLLAIAGLGLLFLFQEKRPPYKSIYVGGIVVESVAYSLVFGSVVIFILNHLPFLQFPVGSSVMQNLMLSFGAGFYEELLYRVLMFGGLFALLNLFWKDKPVVNGLIAALISSLLFAAAHDIRDATHFAYLAVGGMLLNGLYVARGFGVAALTHALYDVWIALGVL